MKPWFPLKFYYSNSYHGEVIPWTVGHCVATLARSDYNHQQRKIHINFIYVYQSLTSGIHNYYIQRQSHKNIRGHPLSSRQDNIFICHRLHLLELDSIFAKSSDIWNYRHLDFRFLDLHTR